MSDLHRNAILAIGVCRLLNLNQKKKQRDRARKMAAYLKMSKAINSNIFKYQLKFDSSSLFRLLGLVRPYISALKVDLEEISVEERLLVTLKYLATGCTFEELCYGSIKPRLLEDIIPETCGAINKCLREYIKLPKTENEWEDIALSFEKKWQFSHCVGALVAKHIAIEKPPYEPEKYLNQKEFHSIALVAVVNANHEFIYIDTGANGGYEYIYSSTLFFEKITEDTLSLPKDSPLKGTEDVVPYVFLGETNFLIENIMRPYTSEMTEEKKIFNYRFSRAKRVADNAFGILYERFGIFHKKIGIKEEHLNSVVMTCCSLHNFLVKFSKDYLNDESFDREDINNYEFNVASWRNERLDGMEWRDTHPLLSLKQEEETVSDSQGAMVREKFTGYFNNVGKVPFQEHMVKVVPELQM